MVKRWRFLLTPAMLLVFMPSLLAQAIQVSLPGTINAAPGGSVSIPIEVGDLTGRNVIAYQMLVVFDTDVILATGASSSGSLSGAFGPPTVNSSVQGKISVGGFGTSPLAGSGTLLNLEFEVVGSPGDTTSLAFESFVFNSGDPPVSTQDGKLVIALPTSHGDIMQLPDVFMLGQNYPNPFNPGTTLVYAIAEAAFVQLDIYNLAGEQVIKLVNDIQGPGRYLIRWNGVDQNGNQSPVGVYLGRVMADRIHKTIKMLKIP